MFSKTGLGPRKVSTLLDWCQSNAVELLAVQLPGRGLRLKESLIRSSKRFARVLFSILAPKLQKTPYCVVGHSVGTWNAFEFLSLARDEGVPMPRKVFFSCFPSPDLPEENRPWKRNSRLSEENFKLEAMQWGINKVVFESTMWQMYQPILRADFAQFDEYEYQREGPIKFDFPISAFFGKYDPKISKSDVERWRSFATSFSLTEVHGNHLFPMGLGDQRDAKVFWLERIVAEMDVFINQ